MSLIWIGDFRSKAIQALTVEDSTYGFLIEDGASYTWFKNTASNQLNKILSATGAVAVNLGFNDCVNSCIWDYFNIETIANDYVTTINELIEQYPDARIYFCSVPPATADFPTAQLDTGVIEKDVLNDRIEQFNSILKKNCTATYMDLYRYFIDAQLSTVDSVRYSKETSTCILNYIRCYESYSMATTSFTPRTSAPVVTTESIDTNGAYWLGDSYGGLNPFDDLGQSYSKCAGDTLPNCTAYAWGRFYEILGSRPTLSTSNAEDWFGYETDGYERGQTPKLGAVICWSKGQVGYQYDDGAGHVAIVEQINSDGSIVTSESGWNVSDYWWTSTRVKGDDGNWGQSSSYKFQGFIYNPAVQNGSVAGYVQKSQVTSSNSYLGPGTLTSNLSNVNQITDEMKINATYIWQYFSQRGWTLNAVAGMLGNMQAESTLNPGIWQNLREWVSSAYHGYGLVQWTPYTKYTDWCAANNYDIGDIDSALIRIEAEVEAFNGPWIEGLSIWQCKSGANNMTFNEFIVSTDDPAWLAVVFLLSYEKPADQSDSVKAARGRNATYWYEYLSPFAPLAPGTTIGKPLVRLSNIRASDLTTTSARVSCVTRGASEVSYKFTDRNDKVIEEASITIDKEEETDVDVNILFFKFENLLPNAEYKVSVSLTDESSDQTEETAFTTLQSFPKTVSSISLIQNDTKLPNEQFLLVTTPNSQEDFGYWAKNGYGYTLQLVVNGAIKSEKNVNSISTSQNISIKSYFGYTPKLGDVIQIGVRTWTLYEGEKLFDSNHSKVSNSVCMLKKPVIPYLNIK